MVEAFLSRIIRRGPLKKEFVDNPDLDPRIRIRSALLFHFDTHQQPKNPLLGDGERTYTPKQIATRTAIIIILLFKCTFVQKQIAHYFWFFSGFSKNEDSLIESIVYFTNSSSFFSFFTIPKSSYLSI